MDLTTFNSLGVALMHRRLDSAPSCGNARKRVSRETMREIVIVRGIDADDWYTDDSG